MCYPPESVRALWSRSWRRADERLSQFQTNCALPMPSSGDRRASSGESHCQYYAVSMVSGFRRPSGVEVDDGGFLMVVFGGIAFWMISSRAGRQRQSPADAGPSVVRSLSGSSRSGEASISGSLNNPRMSSSRPTPFTASRQSRGESACRRFSYNERATDW